MPIKRKMGVLCTTPSIASPRSSGTRKTAANRKARIVPSLHLRTKIIDDHPYLYAVDNVWSAGSPKVAFQTYLGRADLLQGARARPLIKTFHFGAVAVLLQLARQLQIVEIVNRV